MGRNRCVRLLTYALLAVLLLTGTGFAKTEVTYLTRLRAEEFGRQAFDTIVAEFEKKYPDIKVTFIDTTYDKLREEVLLRAQAGTPPDITEPPAGWVPSLIEAGILEPVKDYVPPEHLANFPGSMLDDGTIDGVLYTVPIWSGPILLFLNKELAKRAGYPLKGPEDVFEFKEMIAKIGSLGVTKEGEKIYGFALRNVKTHNSALWFMTWLWTWGGKLVDRYNKPAFDSMGARRALEFYQWLTGEGYSAKGADHYPTRITFSQGRAGFIFDGTWLRGMLRTITESDAIDDMYIPVTVPKGWDGTNWGISNYSDMVVLSGSQHKKEAFTFLKHFTSDESVIRIMYEKMGMMPAHLKMLQKSWCEDPFLDAPKKQNPYSRGVPWKHAKWPGAQDFLARALTEAVAGKDVNLIAQEVQRDLEDLLAD
ncbi:MAG: sugar ABC transporter substrate-binding protein [Candidatus Aerophobus sp.]|nr:MAG: sugar ABC transporter substrate-binding protein [Candidatus Aerophobus sp.]